MEKQFEWKDIVKPTPGDVSGDAIGIDADRGLPPGKGWRPITYEERGG